MSEFDVVIIGSGPAGVSAAFPLVEAGLRVMMIDPDMQESVAPPDMNYQHMRRHLPHQQPHLLGKNFEALVGDALGSPKFRIPSQAQILEGYTQHYPHEAKNFAWYGSLKTGGLSNSWGAGIACFDEEDLKDYPLAAKELMPAYQAIAKRIGISGSSADALSDFFGSDLLLQQPPASSELVETLLKHPKPHARLTLGRSRQATITMPQPGRKACDLSATCMWGCAKGAIYNAAYEAAALARYANFTHMKGVMIESVGSDERDAWARGIWRKDGAAFSIHAPKLILACGAIPSAKLVLSALHMVDVPVPFVSSPSAMFALLLPKFIGRAMPERDFALGQMSLVARYAQDRYAFGNLLTTTGIPAGEFVSQLPFSRRTSQAIARLLMPAMLVGNCFFPGIYARHTLTLANDDTLRLSGAYDAAFDEHFIAARKIISRGFARAGALMVPGSFALSAIGSDMHYAATTPMRDMPKPHETHSSGEVAGLANIYVADGGALTSLPAKAHTFTIMANAHRIASGIAQTFIQA